MTSRLPLKNLAGAIIFTVLLGPVGLLYSSVRGGVIMILLFFIVVCAGFLPPIIVVWVFCSVWSASATNRYNAKILQAQS